MCVLPEWAATLLPRSADTIQIGTRTSNYYVNRIPTAQIFIVEKKWEKRIQNLKKKRVRERVNHGEGHMVSVNETTTEFGRKDTRKFQMKWNNKSRLIEIVATKFPCPSNIFSRMFALFVFLFVFIFCFSKKKRSDSLHHNSFCIKKDTIFSRFH